ncbi:MAG: hydrogen peroxide-inducible genes activator [Pseudomonadales bacterium]|jgi:LysR family hydrogen peroxide-inducible transcriptional activator|nr:hydrogen peroxide-inducible genes activator [Pseudomonadales bacterium]
MSYLPTLRQLRYFLALTRHKHFGRAADECNVSQSAFSIAIRELETQLELCLVDRTSKRVTITATGQEIATIARHCLNDAEELVEFARRERTPLARRIQLGVIPTIAPFLLPRLMPQIAGAFPQMKLYLREDMTENLLAALAEGRLDVLLLALPWDLPHAEILPLFRDPFRLACRSGSSLLESGRVRADRLPAESVLLLEDGHCLRDHALSACRLRQPDRLNRFAASSLFTLVQMVAADLGVTYLPAMAEGSSLLDGTGIVTHALDARAYRDIGLAWREGSARADEFRELGTLINACRPAGVLDLPGL